MSFEMKYDRDGMPIKTPENEPTTQNEDMDQAASTADDNLAQEIMEGSSPDDSSTSSPDETHSEDENTASTTPQKSDKEENFRQLREKAERLERERNEAFKMAQELQDKYKTTTNQSTEQESSHEDENLNIDPDSLVEGKHLSKFQKKIKKLEEQIKQYEKKTTEMSVEAQLKAQYPDFDKVVSKENVESLREVDPDIADAIYYTPDLAKKGKLAYKMIKKYDIAQPDNYQEDRQRAHKNNSKPRPVNSIAPQSGDTPLSNANAFANGLTPSLKEQLRKEMEESRKKG